MQLHHRVLVTLATLTALTVAACAVPEAEVSAPRAASAALHTHGYNDLNQAAGEATLYEVQVRTANACHPDVGSWEQRSACAAKVAPHVPYRAEGMACGHAHELERIRLGTLDDMLEPHTDFRRGITVSYVDERVGANTLWLMPLFVNNDRWAIPDACDNLGSPYAVRDYFHARGTLSRRCIRQGRDEYSASPCWGNGELEELIAQAHERGMKVILDVALNHFGHNYLMYDVASPRPIRERTAAGEPLQALWDFEATFEPELVWPELLDSPEHLALLAEQDPAAATTLASLRQRCPALEGAPLVRAFHMWRVAFDWEREVFSCEGDALERNVPGFYLGANRWDPSGHLGDNHSNHWRDVKFLYHHEDNHGHHWQFVRTREYLFRILNYWASRGVDGFRLDHTTEPTNGLGSNEWKYIVSKVDHYAWRRGQQRPIFLAEEFHEQEEMNKVADIMTEGYVRDMCGRGGRTKDTGWVQQVIDNTRRFDGHTYVMTALETHDERRLTDGTGFDVWTGAGFWGIGAAQWSTPMLLMGQELGEPRRLAFRKSDFLRSRFEPHPQADTLLGYYHRMLTQRERHANRALRSTAYSFLRSRYTGRPDSRILAQARWTPDGSVVFVIHNLWEQDVQQIYTLDGWLVDALGLEHAQRYALVDLLSGQQLGPCHTGAQLSSHFYVALDRDTRAQWLRLEECGAR